MASASPVSERQRWTTCSGARLHASTIASSTSTAVSQNARKIFRKRLRIAYSFAPLSSSANSKITRLPKFRVSLLLACARCGVDVADATDGLDALSPGDAFPQLFADLAHVNVKRAVPRHELAPEHLLGKRFTRDYIAGGAQQPFQQAELDCG